VLNLTVAVFRCAEFGFYISRAENRDGAFGFVMKTFWMTAFLKGQPLRSGDSGFRFRFDFGGILPPRRIWFMVTFERDWREGDGGERGLKRRREDGN
jgi:hypothetical protein